MNNKKINLFICILIIALSFCCCGKKSEKSEINSEITYGFEKVVDNEAQQNTGGSGSKNGEHTVSKDESDMSDSEVKVARYARQFKINKANICEKTGVLNIKNLQFSIENINISQELPEGITKEEVTYFYEQVDENGKIDDKHRYIFLDINIKNNNDKEITYFVSSGFFIEMDSNGKIVDSSMEVNYQSLFDESKQGIKDYYKIVLAPHEEVKANLGYIVNSSLAESDGLYYAMNIGGDELSEEVKAFKITDAE